MPESKNPIDLLQTVSSDEILSWLKTDLYYTERCDANNVISIIAKRAAVMAFSEHIINNAQTAVPKDRLFSDELDYRPLWVSPVEENADWTPQWALYNNKCCVVHSRQRIGAAYYLYPKDYGTKWIAHMREQLFEAGPAPAPRDENASKPPRYGDWLLNDEGEPYCSRCNEPADIDRNEYEGRGKIRYAQSAYCPNCGADMIHKPPKK